MHQMEKLDHHTFVSQQSHARVLLAGSPAGLAARLKVVNFLDMSRLCSMGSAVETCIVP